MISALSVAISAERNGSTWTTASSWPFNSGSFICGNGTSVNRTLVRSTPCFSRAATACSHAELLITFTATRLPSRSLSVLTAPLLDRLQSRDRVAKCDVDAARLQHRHGKGTALELSDLDVETLGLEEPL